MERRRVIALKNRPSITVDHFKKMKGEGLDEKILSPDLPLGRTHKGKDTKPLFTVAGFIFLPPFKIVYEVVEGNNSFFAKEKVFVGPAGPQLCPPGS